MTQEKLHNITLCKPPKSEQIQITKYIEEQTSKINKLITEKESLITKLQEKRKALINEVVTKGLNPNAPMRDSGIEWLGMIPEHWKVTKINRTFNEIGSGTTPTSGTSKYYENGDINWLNTGDLNDGVITKTNKRITSAATKEFSTLKLYPKGSVVIALYGATIGKLGLLEIDTTTNQACCVLSDSKSITQKYLFYYLYSSREHIISLAYGGGQPNISQELIKQLPILQTSIEEQSDIVNFIESRTTKIDEIVSETQLQIQKLKEYKTAVISEVVTGKVDVREWKPKNN
jgi:type I restriction enzyme S subunit